MTINNAIQKAIAENLPSAVADELKEFIAKAQQDSENLLHYQEEDERKDNLISSHEKTIEELRKNAKRSDELDTIERNIKVFTAELKAQHAEIRATELYNLMNIIFRNQTIQRSVTGSVPVYVPGTGNGSTGYVNTVSTSSTETEQVS